MQYRARVPIPPLSNFIERLGMCSDTPTHARERILPSGTFELVINLRADEIRIGDFMDDPPKCYSGAVISGAYERFFVIDPTQHASIIGVHFKPGGAARFLSFPAGELAVGHVDLEACWGTSVRFLRERLCVAVTAEERFSILEETLLKKLRFSAAHPAVATALDVFNRPGANVQVRDVVSEVGLSHRRFIQLFTQHVGLSPKLYSRIQRFQRARETVRDAAASPDWAAVASDCGYFDQAHLHRDFQQFCGFSPATYLRQHSDGVLPNHVPQR